MKNGNIYFADASYEENEKSKKRPVLVWDFGSDFRVYKITTKYKNKSEKIRSNYFPIFDWDNIGLIRPSYIDCNSYWTLEQFKGIKLKYLTSLSTNDVIRFRKFVNKRRSIHRK